MVRAIVGANWGDEGKGKITDMLAKESDIIVRFQGGSNAGHTIINNYGKFALHLLPSGVFYNHTTSIIGNGVALNIPFLVKEFPADIRKRKPPLFPVRLQGPLGYSQSQTDILTVHSTVGSLRVKPTFYLAGLFRQRSQFTDKRISYPLVHTDNSHKR